MYEPRAVISVLPDDKLHQAMVDGYWTVEALKATESWLHAVAMVAAYRPFCDEIQHRKSLIHGHDWGQALSTK